MMSKMDYQNFVLLVTMRHTSMDNGIVAALKALRGSPYYIEVKVLADGKKLREMQLRELQAEVRTYWPMDFSG